MDGPLPHANCFNFLKICDEFTVCCGKSLEFDAIYREPACEYVLQATDAHAISNKVCSVQCPMGLTLIFLT